MRKEEREKRKQRRGEVEERERTEGEEGRKRKNTIIQTTEFLSIPPNLARIWPFCLTQAPFYATITSAFSISGGSPTNIGEATCLRSFAAGSQWKGFCALRAALNKQSTRVR